MNEEIENKIDNLPYLKPINKEEEKQEETKEEIFDTYQEQIEAPQTTIHSPESIKAKELKNIDKHPERYIEINMIKKIRVVDNFYIPSNIKCFHYKNILYNIVEENIYIFPTKKDFFIMTAFYFENKNIPVTFKQQNEGITGKALTTLHTPEFYEGLHDPEEVKYNLFIVALFIASITGYLVGLYFLLAEVLGITI